MARREVLNELLNWAKSFRAIASTQRITQQVSLTAEIAVLNCTPVKQCVAVLTLAIP